MVWLYRDTSPDWTPKDFGGVDPNQYNRGRRGGQNLAIARKIVSVEKRNTAFGDIGNILNNASEKDEQVIQSRIRRHKKKSSLMIDNVCQGIFHKT